MWGGQQTEKPVAERTKKLITTIKQVESAEPGTHSLGDGLSLIVSKSQSRRWVYRYQLRGDRRDMGLGSFPEISLAAAREARDAAKKLVKRGIDPIEDRDAEAAAKAAERDVPFFGEFAVKVLDAAPFKREDTREFLKYLLGPKNLPTLQKVRVNEVTTQQIVDALKPRWRVTAPTAEKMRSKIERVLDAARVEGFITGDPPNPARWRGHLELILGAQNHKTTHHKALPYERIGEAYAIAAAHPGMSARLLQFQILVVVRNIEARLSRWGEFDLEEGIWFVPDENIKTDKHMTEPFIVPLSKQAVALLRSIMPPGGDPDPKAPVFPSLVGRKSRRGQPMCNRAARAALGRMGLQSIATPHGMRSTFRDWAGDCTDHPRELTEMCLGHKVGDDAELSYRRRTALEKRRLIMQSWADRCCDPSQDKVVSFMRRAKAAA
jgi:integrase